MQGRLMSPEFAHGLPHPRLRPFVAAYTGYRICGDAPGVHMGLRSLTFIVAFDAPVDVTFGGGRGRYWGLLAGLHDRPAVIRHNGDQHGVQLDVTPAGALALFGVSPGALARQVAHLDAVVPEVAAEIIGRLTEAPNWPARWSALDNLFLRRLAASTPPNLRLQHAWGQLVAGCGATTVTDLADQVGWHRQHFARQFRSAYGLSPKVMSRIVRFERAQRLLRQPPHPSLASVAAACGYADQAHMTREWHQFAGTSPSVWLRNEVIPFVQDD